jgi:hypothetical protein
VWLLLKVLYIYIYIKYIYIYIFNIYIGMESMSLYGQYTEEMHRVSTALKDAQLKLFKSKIELYSALYIFSFIV